MKQHPIVKFWANNSLSIVLFALFFVFTAGMSVSGWQTANNEATTHNQPQQSYGQYVASGDFIEGIFENWESEFLQMWALVGLTIWLRQKGADDSKPLRGSTPQDTSSRYSILRSTNWAQRKKAIKHAVYSRSLSLALLAMFIVSFSLHAVGGAAKYNQESQSHNDQSRVSAIGYMGTSQFWYESLQNWQSEFLAIGTLLLLSIKLRQRGSPESKPVGKRYNAKTGN